MAHTDYLSCPFCNNTPIVRNEDSTLRFVSNSMNEFLEYIITRDVDDLIQNLQMIHDIAVYHSRISLDDPEKQALYDLQFLIKDLKSIRVSE